VGVHPSPSPVWDNFSITMECSPESGRNQSVYSVVQPPQEQQPQEQQPQEQPQGSMHDPRKQEPQKQPQGSMIHGSSSQRRRFHGRNTHVSIRNSHWSSREVSCRAVILEDPHDNVQLLLVRINLKQNVSATRYCY
jgi:hypothetical protein